jgi:hypothetical protein
VAERSKTVSNDGDMVREVESIVRALPPALMEELAEVLRAGMERDDREFTLDDALDLIEIRLRQEGHALSAEQVGWARHAAERWNWGSSPMDFEDWLRRPV